jgi:hypothetical protein
VTVPVERRTWARTGHRAGSAARVGVLGAGLPLAVGGEAAAQPGSTHQPSVMAFTTFSISPLMSSGTM